MGAGEWKIGGEGWRGGVEELPLGAVVSDCIVYLALCEWEGYVRFQSLSTITTVEKFSMRQSCFSFQSNANRPLISAYITSLQFRPLVSDEDVKWRQVE